MNRCWQVLASSVALSVGLWAAPPAGTVLINGQPAMPGRVIAKVRSDMDVQRAQTIASERTPVRSVRKLGAVSGLMLIDLEAPVAARATTGADESARRLQASLTALKASGQFEYVEPDYVLNLAEATDEAAYADGRLWGLENRGTPGLAGADIDVERAWALTTGSSQMIVAVLDSGIRTTHQDLRDNLWINPGEIPENGLDDDENGYVDDVHGADMTAKNKALSDDNGHGTHVAGTIAAAAGNSGPHVGVAPNVRVMGIRAGDANGRLSQSAIIDGLGYAVRQGAKVVNASFGGPIYSRAQYDALDHARSAGLLIVCAAGNDGQNNDSTGAFPAGYRLPNVLSVAALDRFGRLADFSNYGVETVHLAAPGTEIFSCGIAGDDSYAVMQGTSMAAPHVAGVAALIWSRLPQATATEVRQRLLQSVVPLPSLAAKVQSGGMVSAFRALAVEPDGHLEIELRPRNSPYLVAGRENVVEVSVSDVEAIVGGTVAQSVGGTPGTMLNDLGNPPDLRAGDGVFSGAIAPTASGEQLLELSTTWNGKAVHISRQVLVQAPAGNDDWANAYVLPFSRGQTHGNTYGATKEWFEPATAPNGSTVWYAFTANQQNDYLVQVRSRDFEPTVRVYTLGSSSPVRLVDQTNSWAIVPPQPIGTTLLVSVESSNSQQGEFDLLLNDSPAPNNDNVADAILLPGKHFQSTVGDNRYASKESNEPAHAGNVGGRSIWWRYVPPATGRFSVSTRGSSFDTLLAVYDSQYRQLAANDDDQEWMGTRVTTSRVELEVTEGQSVWIAVDGRDDSGQNENSGRVNLMLQLTPDNNFYAGALELIANSPAVTDGNFAASKGTSEPHHGGDPGGASVWFKWTALAGGRAQVSVIPQTAGFNPMLAVYVGPDEITAVSDWQQVSWAASAGDFSAVGGQTVVANFDAEAGRTYRIAVDGRREGFLFPQADVGAFAIGIVAEAKVGRAYHTDFEAAANQPTLFKTQASSRSETVGAGWQISGNASLLLTPDPEPDVTSMWYFENIASLERGRTEYSCRFRELGGNEESRWIVGFLILPVSYSADSIGPNAQLAAIGMGENGTDVVLLVGSSGTSSSVSIPSLAPGATHKLKLGLDTAAEHLQAVLNDGATSEVPLNFIGQKNLAVGPVFVFRGKPVNGVLPQLIIDDLDLHVRPRRVAPQLAAVHSVGLSVQLRVMGDPIDELRWQASTDLVDWAAGQPLAIPESGDRLVELGPIPGPSLFVRRIQGD